MNDNALLVSVICPTYNHEKYIAQALDGFVMQKTNFRFEVIVHDDASTDTTSEIVKDYEAKYPKLFNNIYQTENQFSKSISNPSEITFSAAQGKYIALCEGDDFWTDGDKLQIQIDFLEKNPDFAICFHNSRVLHEEDPGKIEYSNPANQTEISTFEDLAKGEFIYTATCVFRTANYKKMPEQFYKYLNNYTLDLQNAQFGKIKYMNKVMSTYRIHKHGMWSMVARQKTLINQLPTYKFYLGYFDKKYKKYFLGHLKNMTSELISIKLASGDFKDYWKYYKDYVYYNFRDISEIKRMGIFFVRANYDNITRLIKRK